MATPPAGEETLVLLEHRYVCSECGHLAAALGEALAHQQHQHPPPPQHQYELLGAPEPPQYQCLECGQLLVTPGQLLEHQELHIKLLAQEPEPPAGVAGVAAGAKPSAGIHFECPECRALFASQELWLSHRQSHRAPNQSQSQSHARVDLEHSYRKPGEDDDAGDGDAADTVQLLLYECGECRQLFQSPKDFLEHQAAHLTPPLINGGANEAKDVAE
ncbi:ZN574 protein, partial [Caloenas nicobarica]|nr:ZN574 protein [Caloenas nicobarica]